MNQAISDTAEFGGIKRGNRIINENVRNVMRLILEEIQSGKFHKEWIDEYESGYPQLQDMREKEKQIPIEKISKQLLKVLFENK